VQHDTQKGVVNLEAAVIVDEAKLSELTGWPASAPSPKKSPGPNTPTTASLPALESTDSLTLPFTTLEGPHVERASALRCHPDPD